MLALLAATIGAVANRLRGGGVVLFPGETTVPDHKRTQVRRMVYLFALGSIAMLGGTALWQAALGALAVFLMLLTGWGRPIGAVGGWETNPLEEFGPFDWLATKVAGNRKRLWGFVWLSCWGLVAGGLLALTLGSVFPIISFGLIGATYWSVFQVYLWWGRAASEGWETAELAFGAISFLGLIT